MNLRDYQSKLIDAITEAAMTSRRILVVLPTGGGKTVIFSHLAQHANSNKKNVLILVHRRELLFQTQDKLKKFGVEHTPMLRGKFYDQSYSVVVASIPTMHSWVVRRKKEAIPPADIVIIDEAAHMQSSRTWQDIAGLYPNAFIVGFTATPISKAGKGLGGHFDYIVKGPTISELTAGGWLVPVKYVVPTVPDLHGVKISKGDYAEDQLEAAMDKQKLIGDICENWAIWAKGRKTLVFAVGVKHSIHIANEFNKIGVKAEHVDGNTDPEERAAIIKRFSEGDTQVMSSCGVFLEGFDAPVASALVFARPTKSLMLFLQAAGRGLRAHPGKKDLVFLDHSGVLYEHGPVDQDFDWKLEYLKGDTERRSAIRKAKIRKTITCEKCHLVYDRRLDCPECGTMPKVAGKAVSTYAAYLQALDEIDYPKVDKKSWYLQFLHYARSTGKKDGWAFFKYQEKFKEKPAWAWKELEPIETGVEVASFIRSRNIAWAKSQQNTKNGARPWKQDQWTPQTAAAHGLNRKDILGGDAYVKEP